MAFDELITDADAAEMLRHWLATPRNSLLGQPYGNRIAEWLQEPLQVGAVGRANDAVRDLRADIALFESEVVDVFVETVKPGKQIVIFEIGRRYRVGSDGGSAMVYGVLQ